MTHINPTVLSLWITAGAITYGLTGDIQSAVLAVGIATFITTLTDMLT